MPGSPSSDDDKNENPWEAEAVPEPSPTSSPALDDVALRDDELKENVAGSPTAPHPAADLAEPVKSPPGFGSFDLDGAIIAVLLVNFHHLMGPIVEFSHPPNILSSPLVDPEIPRLLPFLALPDGAHLSDEDYSYFHLVSCPPKSESQETLAQEPFPSNKTVFGISCNRQLPASELINRPADVTRSTVQMAVVVLARQPVFGPIRDKLGLITRAFFAQRDFTSTAILVDFYASLQLSMRGAISETTFQMGTSLRELIHKFRNKTLVLLKLLLLQKKIMFFGYPVEALCTFQYSLISLIPGLLMNLSDCGSPTLDIRASMNRRASSLRTSDRASLLRFFGFPLNLFGKNAFFQPYLPLQQIDMCREAASWVVGTTNSVMLQQKDAAYDCLVNIEHANLEFKDLKLERIVTLTPADRKWMDEIVKTVDETWNPSDPSRPINMSFRGSDDFLRAKFEEYLCSALSSVKYADFLAKAGKADIALTGTKVSSTVSNFSLPWVSELRSTTAFQQWDQATDPVLFDIWEPAHPTPDTNAVSDIGLRLKEGMQELHLEKNLGPTRDALSSAFTAGSTSFLRAFDNVRTGISTQLASLPSTTSTGGASASAEPFPGGVSSSQPKSPADAILAFPANSLDFARRLSTQALRSTSDSSPSEKEPSTDTRGISSFWGGKFSGVLGRSRSSGTSASSPGGSTTAGSSRTALEEDDLGAEWMPVDLDAKREDGK